MFVEINVIFYLCAIFFSRPLSSADAASAQPQIRAFIYFHHYYLPLAMGNAECSKWQPVDDVCLCALWLEWWCRNKRKVFFYGPLRRFVPRFFLSSFAKSAMGLHPNFIHRNLLCNIFFRSLSLFVFVSGNYVCCVHFYPYYYDENERVALMYGLTLIEWKVNTYIAYVGLCMGRGDRERAKRKQERKTTDTHVLWNTQRARHH